MRGRLSVTHSRMRTAINQALSCAHTELGCAGTEIHETTALALQLSPSRRQEALSTSQGSGVTIYQRLGDLSGDVIILAEGWAAGRDGVKTF